MVTVMEGGDSTALTETKLLVAYAVHGALVQAADGENVPAMLLNADLIVPGHPENVEEVSILIPAQVGQEIIDGMQRSLDMLPKP